MRRVAVQVKADYLKSLISVRKPILAISELIWNALDADATLIKVVFVRDEALDSLTEIRIIDNGHGISNDDAIPAFENLGGSWKRNTTTSKTKKRLLHGKEGKGRFRAFALGGSLEWQSRFRNNGKTQSLIVRGNASNVGEFEVEDAVDVSDGATGTEVVITDILKKLPALFNPNVPNELAEHFALYLRSYSDVQIWYDGKKIDPTTLESRVTDYNLSGLSLGDGSDIVAKLVIIEWNAPFERVLNLCDSAGFVLRTIPPGVHASGFNFTAYLKSDYIRTLDHEGLLQVDELHANLQELISQAKTTLREHFRLRAAESVSHLVAEWKRQEIYPYEGEPQSIIERTERQVFDVCAANVSSYLPEFDESPKKSKQFTFTLLREALKDSPEALTKILGDVLELPLDKQQELARLLEKTTLSAIINASKTVADRLNFLRGLEILVFDQQSKPQLLERKQLHRILADQTWIFGEEYNLTVDDQSLTEVLNGHLELLGRERNDSEPVVREDGSTGIVDLMLSRRIPLPRPEDYEHLIVELKRPTQKIDSTVEQQIKSYAFAVAEDERFKDTNTKWIFWAISNEISDGVQRSARQRNRPEGLLYEDTEGHIYIWVKTWGQLISSCRARLEFFKKELDYSADRDSARSYLQQVYAKYLPQALQS